MNNSLKTAYLVVDTETIPDGKLLSMVKYAKDDLTPEQAIERAQQEARERSPYGSDFLPVSYHVPVAICVIRVASDLTLERITCLDTPQFRPRVMVQQFWEGLARFPQANLVTFNGRGFDMPLLEIAAFRYGISCGRDYFIHGRNRYRDGHFDLLAWLNNFGACRHSGGLNLLAKLLGKPGKMEVAGAKVLAYYQAGKLQEISNYCMCDTLDTYFAFLRSRVVMGELTLEEEQELVQKGKAFLIDQLAELPGLQQYLDNWGDWEPWP